jgi:flagellar basal-body rod modification protein FlgD
MTDISPAQGPAPTTGTPPAPASPAPSTGAGQQNGAREGTLLSSDFDTFLRMLTTQAQNQDPLNPLDSTDFAVQLATFSSVEQQVKTNELLTTLGDAIGATGLGRLAGWVGMEARAAVPVRFDGAPVDLSLAPSADAARAELVVRDANDTVWDRLDVTGRSGAYTWNGTGADGSPLPARSYSFQLTSYDAQGEAIETTTPEAFGRVTEVRAGDEGTEIVFAGGAVAASDDVSALRAP